MSTPAWLTTIDADLAIANMSQAKGVKCSTTLIAGGHGLSFTPKETPKETCATRQASMFCSPPKKEVDHIVLLRGLHRIQERGGSAQDEENYLRRMGFQTSSFVSVEKHLCAIGECEPLKQMAKANEACTECIQSIMETAVEVVQLDAKPDAKEEEKVQVGQIVNGHGWDRHTCTIHGSADIRIDDNDTSEGYTVECGFCKANKHCPECLCDLDSF
jgi:hypothetical protein